MGMINKKYCTQTKTLNKTMQIISTNIVKPTTITWNGKQETTGIYKTLVYQPFYLGKEEINGGEISNKKVYGDEFKTCYLFSADHYPYWKNLYPNLNWHWGMLGENLTVKKFRRDPKLYIDDIYKW